MKESAGQEDDKLVLGVTEGGGAPIPIIYTDSFVFNSSEQLLEFMTDLSSHLSSFQLEILCNNIDPRAQ